MKNLVYYFICLSITCCLLSLRLSGQELEPPSIPYPSTISAIPSAPTATFDTATWANDRAGELSRLESALGTDGAYIKFGPGDFDLSGINTPVLTNVKVEGAGKELTRLYAGFNMFPPTGGDSPVFGAMAGHVELVNIEFDGWRRVIVAKSTDDDSPDGSLSPDGINGLDHYDLMRLAPQVAGACTFGFRMYNVRVKNSGGAVYGTHFWYFNNIYIYHCDFINLWHAICLRGSYASKVNIFYDCYFQDCILPRVPDEATDNYKVRIWAGLSPGITQGGNVDNTRYQGIDNRFEHCTFDGVSNETDNGNPDETSRQFSRTSCYWGGGQYGGAEGGNWWRNCKFLNMGFNSTVAIANGAAESKIKYQYASCIIYAKGRFDYERIHIDNCCMGHQGIFDIKGPQAEAPEWGYQGTGHITKMYVHRVRKGAEFGPQDAYALNLMGPEAKNSEWRNVWVEDAIFDEGIIAKNGNDDHHGHFLFQDITVKNLTIHGTSGYSNVAGAFNFGTNDIGDNTKTAITADNIRIEGFQPGTQSLPASAFMFASGSVSADYIDIDDVYLNLSADGIADAALFVDYATGVDDIRAEPTGVITGNSGSIYSQYGTGSGAISSKLLGGYAGYNGQSGVLPPGANLDWMSDDTIIGCHYERNLSSLNDTIVVSAVTNGSVKPYGNVLVSKNNNRTFYISADDGYKIEDVLVDGVSVGAVSSYTFTNVTSGHIISASFTSLPKYTITASAGLNGNIYETGDILVLEGNEKTFYIVSDDGYKIEDVLVDGVSVGAVSSYTFTNVSGNHTISASFIALPEYTINASAGSNGMIEPAGEISVTKGNDQTFIITQDENYKIEDVLVDGVSVGAVSSYTFTDVSGNHTISASFIALPEYTINASADSNGIIEPSGEVIVIEGNNQTFTFTPDDGYDIENVQIDGVSTGDIPYYTFPNVTGDHTISVTFSIATSAIKNHMIDDVVSIYPNPLNDNVMTMYLPEISNKNVTLQIIDMTGKTTLMKSDLRKDKKKHMIDLSGLSKGVYILKIGIEKNIYFKKVIKQ